MFNSNYSNGVNSIISDDIIVSVDVEFNCISYHHDHQSQKTYRNSIDPKTLEEKLILCDISFSINGTVHHKEERCYIKAAKLLDANGKQFTRIWRNNLLSYASGNSKYIFAINNKINEFKKNYFLDNFSKDFEKITENDFLAF